MRIWVEAKDDLKWRLEFDGKNKEGFRLIWFNFSHRLD